jgi:hypothetical protein
MPVTSEKRKPVPVRIKKGGGDDVIINVVGRNWKAIDREKANDLRRGLTAYFADEHNLEVVVEGKQISVRRLIDES